MQRLPQFAVGWQPSDPRAVSLLAQPQPAHFRSVTASPNSDQATAQTIRIMCQHIANAIREPTVQAAADDAMLRFRGGPPPAPANPLVGAACSDWWWCKHFLTFVHHEKLIQIWLGEVGQLQLLIPPEALLELKHWVGDCAVYTMILGAMLKCQGIAYEIVTVATEPSEPSVFNHVYPRAVIAGHRLPLDASHGDRPGWQVPSRDVFRLQVWNEQGEPIADEGTRFTGLHGYRRGVSGIRGLGRARRRRGLGMFVCTDPNNADTCYDDGTTASNSTTLTPWMGLPATSPGIPQVTPTPVTTPPAAPGFNWANLVGSLATQWSKIGGQVVAPQTTLVRGPNGQLMYSSPAGSGGAPTSLLGTSGLSGSTILILAVVAIGGIALMNKK